MDWYPKFQMNYTSIVDLIQVFANEYCVPNSIVLLIGTLKLEENEKIRSIFNFINSELIVVDSIKGSGVDILLNSNGDLPFENHSFDLIIKINALSNLNLSNYLKYNGKLLINEEVIGCCELCYLDNIPFSIV
jgi:hypothetical protein